jgi:hypothetical protein
VQDTLGPLSSLLEQLSSRLAAVEAHVGIAPSAGAGGATAPRAAVKVVSPVVVAWDAIGSSLLEPFLASANAVGDKAAELVRGRRLPPRPTVFVTAAWAASLRRGCVRVLAGCTGEAGVWRQPLAHRAGSGMQASGPKVPRGRRLSARTGTAGAAARRPRTRVGVLSPRLAVSPFPITMVGLRVVWACFRFLSRR